MDTIKIKGLKSLRDVTLALRPVNLLIGANGAGKSNVLSFFNLLGNAYEGRLESCVALAGGAQKFLYKGAKTTQRIETEVAQGSNAYRLTLAEADGKLIVEKESLGYNGGYTDIGRYTKETSIKHYAGMSRGDHIRNYLSSIRIFHFHDTGHRSPFTAECHATNDSYLLYSRGENLAAVLLRIRREAPLTYRRIVSVVRSVAPYFADFFLHPSPAGTLRLQWQDKHSEMIYGPADFSDGTVRFVALATLFLQPTLPKVIVVDEPELGLHPTAIGKLAALIKLAAKTGTQVIAATQSAELISLFNPEDVLTVTARDDGSHIERLNGEKLKAWLREYSLGELWKQDIVKGGPR